MTGLPGSRVIHLRPAAAAVTPDSADAALRGALYAIAEARGFDKDDDGDIGFTPDALAEFAEMVAVTIRNGVEYGAEAEAEISRLDAVIDPFEPVRMPWDLPAIISVIRRARKRIERLSQGELPWSARVPLGPGLVQVRFGEMIVEMPEKVLGDFRIIDLEAGR